MHMHPAYILFHAIWFWGLMVEAALSDLNALSGRKPAVALVVIAGGKSGR